MKNKVVEIQNYLRARGIKVSETTIVNMAIEIVERLGTGYYTFACEFELEERLKKREEEKEK